MANEQLVVQLEARVRDFERQMQRANRTATANFTDIERRGARMTKTLQGMGTGAFGGLIRGATLALAPILSVGAALNTAKAALDDFDAIAKSAKATGLDAESFQEFAYAAELGGVTVEAFAKSLETFAKNAGLAAAGKGKMITALKVLNPELLASIQAATTQEQRLKLAADAIDKAGSASAKAALATTLFGDSGTRMVEVLKGGSAALAETAKQARNLGIIVDSSLIARAETMSDEFSTATKVMNIQFQQALIDLAPLLIGTAKLAGDLASAVNYLTESMANLGERGTARLEQDLAGIDSTLAAANATMAPGVVGTMGVQIDPDTQAKMQAERDAIFAELKRRAVDKLRVDLSRPTPSEDPTMPDASGDAAAKAALKHGDAVKKLIADLQFERDTLGETALEQTILNTLRQAGVDSASAEGMAIRGLVSDLETQKSAIQANADAMKAFGDATADALGTFIDDMIEGKSLADSFAGILKNLGSQWISAGIGSLTGSSGLGSLFSGIPGRATGGPVQAGQPYIVGEKRPELFVPNTSGRIMPRVPNPGPVTRSAANDNGASVVINIPINATGADAAGLALVRQEVAQLKSELPGRIKQVVGRRSKDIW